MNGTVLQLTLRELQDFATRPRLWVVFAVVVALFAATGPFGTYDRLPFATRLGYWLANHALSWCCALFLVVFFKVLLAGRIAHVLPRMLIGAGAAALPIGLVIAGLNHAVMDVPFNGAQWLESVGTALPVSLALCLIVWLSMDGSGAQAASIPGPKAAPLIQAAGPASVASGLATANSPSAAPQASTGENAPAGTGDIALASHPGPQSPAAAPRPALLDRLPGSKRGPLIRLEVQDHYVLVVTAKGREMLLMRLADAIRETEPVDGLQVHRSHWVARDGVADVIRETGKNGRTLLRTTDGAEIPVSRGNVAGVKGWAG
ncbi:MAG: LytTR family transcriptional regulator DNA-binding domain-containing protein [Notoacmeibacter sp.]|nr:LytTR family transcriptional regulator DNA-binding domain-containing protein [Notoacmeibacter sp.]